MPSALVPRGHCYVQSATFKKVDKTIAQSKCEHSAQPFDKSKFEDIKLQLKHIGHKAAKCFLDVVAVGGSDKYNLEFG